jgi:hypothetical protein
MTASNVEGRLTAVLHQHAEEAMNRTDTATELNRFNARVAQDERARRRRRAGIAAAALSGAAVVVGVLWFSFGDGQSPAPADPASPASSSSAPSAAPEATKEPEAPQTPGSTVDGFEGVESYPMTFVVPRGFSDPTREGGTRGYYIKGTSGGVKALLVSTLAQTATHDLPDDLAAHVRHTRDELIVSNVATSEVGGRPAQTFTLAQKPGRSPYDLICARAGSCYKLLENKPMDVTVVRTGRGLVLFWVEYAPEDRARVQESMQTWLASVRWE